MTRINRYKSSQTHLSQRKWVSDFTLNPTDPQDMQQKRLIKMIWSIFSFQPQQKLPLTLFGLVFLVHYNINSKVLVHSEYCIGLCLDELTLRIVLNHYKSPVHLGWIRLEKWHWLSRKKRRGTKLIAAKDVFRTQTQNKRWFCQTGEDRRDYYYSAGILLINIIREKCNTLLSCGLSFWMNSCSSDWSYLKLHCTTVIQ